MSVEAHKCNVEGCKGFIVFENADFDFKNLTMGASGMYEFSDPTCTECEKQFAVVPSYEVIAVDENGDLEMDVESTCIMEFEKRQKELRYIP